MNIKNVVDTYIKYTKFSEMCIVFIACFTRHNSWTCVRGASNQFSGGESQKPMSTSHGRIMVWNWGQEHQCSISYARPLLNGLEEVLVAVAVKAISGAPHGTKALISIWIWRSEIFAPIN